MSRLFVFDRSYDRNSISISVQEGITRKKLSLLIGYWSPRNTPHLDIPRESIAEYTESISRHHGSLDNVGLYSSISTEQYRRAINKLFDGCSQENINKLYNLRTYSDILNGNISNSQKEACMFFMPSVYCEGCDTSELLYFYWYPYSGIRKTEIKEHFRDYNEPIGYAVQPEVSTCPTCNPSGCEMIRTSPVYTQYSENSQNNCRCAACGR